MDTFVIRFLIFVGDVAIRVLKNRTLYMPESIDKISVRLVSYDSKISRSRARMSAEGTNLF